MARPRFYIADEDGSNKIYLVGPMEPYPFPTPVYETIGSVDLTMGGADAPGEGVIYDGGWGPGILEWECWLDAATKASVDQKYRTWAAGARAPVQVGFEGGDAWICKWTPPGFVPRRSTKPKEAYRAQFKLAIKSEVV